jgi:hypothetical protein
VLVAMNFGRQKAKIILPEGDWRMLLTTDQGVTGALAPFEIQIFTFPD